MNINRYRRLLKQITASFYYGNKFIRRQVFPSWAYINVTRSCNLNCPYCYVLDPKMDSMSKDDVIGVVNKLAQLGTRWISFTGGEPTLVKETLLAGIYQSSRKKGIFTQLPTNGTLLTSDFLEELGRVGVDILDVSVDGLQGSDSKKGVSDHPANFLSMIQKAQRKYGFLVKANVVVTKSNIAQIKELIKFCHDENLMLSVFMGYSPPGNQQIEVDFNRLSVEDSEQVQDLVRYIHSCQKKGVVFAEPMAYSDLWIPFLKNKGNNSGAWKCEAGKYGLNIDPDGIVRICNALPVNEGRLGLHYSQLTPDYHKVFKPAIDQKKEQCQAQCLAAAYFCAQYYQRNLFKFLTHPFYLR